MIRLQQPILEKIKEDKELIAKLQLALKVGERSINGYIKVNDNRLTELNSLNTIVEHFEIPLSTVIDGKYSRLITK